jgi:hypothetical protein
MMIYCESKSLKHFPVKAHRTCLYIQHLSVQIEVAKTLENKRNQLSHTNIYCFFLLLF